MPGYLLSAMNGPTQGEGDEEAYNRWYDEVDLPDFKTLPEIISARRYKALRCKVSGMEQPWPKVTAYEIETDDFAGFSQKPGEKRQTFAPTLDRFWSGNRMTIQVSGDE